MLENLDVDKMLAIIIKTCIHISGIGGFLAIMMLAGHYIVSLPLDVPNTDVTVGWFWAATIGLILLNIGLRWTLRTAKRTEDEDCQ